MKKNLQKKQKNKLGKWFYFHCDIYNVDFVVYIGKQDVCLKNGVKFLQKNVRNNYKNIIDDVTKYLKDTNNPTNNWCMDCSTKSNQCILIVIESLNISDIDDLCVLAHECLHAALYVTDEREITQFKTNNEALTYLFEWIYGKILKLKKGYKK